MLVVYFVFLAGYTIRKVFKQMVRHNYGLDDFAKQKIAKTNEELVGEREMVKGML